MEERTKPFFLKSIILKIVNQADPETDEVYAQMTLQPVNKVGQLFILRIKHYITQHGFFFLFNYVFLCKKLFGICLTV